MTCPSIPEAMVLVDLSAWRLVVHLVAAAIVVAGLAQILSIESDPGPPPRLR